MRQRDRCRPGQGLKGEANVDDLAQAVRYALEPLTQQGQWELCPHCGTTVSRVESHTCRTASLELPGLEHDPKARARSYCVA